jgi:glyoxylase-like metal-dependent hydrolase (beta-lactamase superfamily II)
MIFHQLFEAESSTYTYLLACEKTKEAILIDPVLETVERDAKIIRELELKLIYTIETHVHADHITGADKLKKLFQSKTILSKHANIPCADVLVCEGDSVKFGEHELKIIETKGHTDSCISLCTDGMVFTGDLLFIRGTGRTDFQQGNSKLMYQNIHQKIFSLPPDTKIYPGHDYKGMSYSTVAQELKYNPRVGGGKSEDDFIKIMQELKLADPKKLAIAVPANLKCGAID